MKERRILIVDDHAVTRHGVHLLLDAIDGATVVGEAANGSQALEACAELGPDLVLMDLTMPELGGVEAVRRVTEAYPDIDLVVLTVHEEPQTVLDALNAGASGYLPKSASLDEVRLVLEKAGTGDVALTPALAGRLVSSLVAEDVSPEPSDADRMTPREREILGLLGEGHSARQIARKLGISERTVNTHVNHIYRRIGVNNRVDAVREAMRMGLVAAPTPR